MMVIASGWAFTSGRPNRSRPLSILWTLWHKTTGKVISLAWNSVGADPEIINFKRGEWEDLFLNGAN
jgi:hypothetical protein